MHQSSCLLRVLVMLVVACAWPLATHAGATAAVVRGPYLQSGSSEGVIVRWRTDVATSSRVVFGASPGNLTSTEESLTLETDHIVTLAGLDADTRYYYGVGTTTEILAGDDLDHFFVTAPLAGTRRPVRIWVLGDSGQGPPNGTAVRDAYYAYTGQTHTDLWLLLGDNAYNNGTDQQYQTQFFNVYPEMLRKSVVWSTLGNHDAITPNVYYDIFTLPTNGEAGGLASASESYYSFDYANIHFVVLDSQDGVPHYPSTMMLWFEADLAATTQDWIIAFWHHPPYSKGSHDSDVERDLYEMRENAIPLLDDHGADLTLTGHSHSYERSFLVEGHYGDSTTLISSGPDSMIVDNGDGRIGGDGLYHKLDLAAVPHAGMVHTVTGSSSQVIQADLDHPVMFTSLALFGSVVIDVDSNRLDLTFLDINAVPQDYFTLVKGPLPAPPVADFSAFPLSGVNPMMVNFDDQATNIPISWEWDFESDGIIDSTEQNPSHMYSGPGFYEVTQIVSNTLGTDAEVRTDYICVTIGVPGGVQDLEFGLDPTAFSWLPETNADTYDVIKGDLSSLRSTGGDYSASVMGCLAENVKDARMTDGQDPAPGAAFFYLVRATNCAKQQGTYDTFGPGQTTSRDSMLLGVSSACSCDLIDDSDGDSICDGDDACPNDALNDADADTLCADLDNCPAVANVDQLDGDQDGIGDVCDACPFDSANDIDGDTVCGDVDNCPVTSNPLQEDVDGDLSGDVCDPCPFDAANDFDVDGVCGDIDNCPFDSNPDQSDGDGDAIGDICDVCPADPDNDIDIDFFCGDVDNCDQVYNALQIDSDVDGVGDLCDNCPDKSNSNQTDADGDGAGSSCDCRPQDGSVREPGAVTGLIALPAGPDVLQLNWRVATGADTYSINRGSGSLATGDYGSCVAIGLASPSWQDTDLPASGQLYYYQVVGVSSQCGPGGLGYDTDEQLRVNTNVLGCLGP